MFYKYFVPASERQCLITRYTMYYCFCTAVNGTSSIENKIINGLKGVYVRNLSEVIPNLSALADFRDKYGEHFCSGVLIHSQRVLTVRKCIESRAKHCTESEEFGGIKVFIASSPYDILYWEGRPVGRKVNYNDIAVITVTIFSNIFNI